MKKRLIIFFAFSILLWGNLHAQLREFTSKGIEKEIRKVNDSLYAFRYETSNLEYNIFIDAMAGKDSALYQLYAVDSAKWMDRKPFLSQFYHRSSAFNDYPVLCISYNGAVAYCKWLTDLYNNDDERIFRKVIFTLPSEQDWEFAAMGNKKNCIYPWGTNSLRDTRKGDWQGQFLANFTHLGNESVVSGNDGRPVFQHRQVEVQTGYNDRAFYTASVISFLPNDIGIYNQSGNAAEMTIQKGLIKGGSWNSYGGEITIAYRLYFYEPSPEVGFRVFMKVIEQ